MADIKRRLGTDEFARLRIGIGPVPNGWDPAEFVLSKFAKKEKPTIESSLWRAADAAALWAHDGIEACMNLTNASAEPPSDK